MRTWLAVLASLLGAFMAVLDIAITNASLKDILGALSATQEEGSWISSAYLVAEIVVIPLAGFLATVFSTRRYLIVNVALFLVFSTLCGMAWSLESMIAFRAAQGFTGGVMIPMAMTLVTRKLPHQQAAHRPGAVRHDRHAGAHAGPDGGRLPDRALWLAQHLLHQLGARHAADAGRELGLDKEPMHLDLLRRGLGRHRRMAVGLGSLTAMLEEGNSKDWFQSHFIITAAVLAVVGLYGWAWRGLTRENTFIDLHILGRPSFLIAAVIAFTTGMGLYGSAFILPLYLGQIAGYTPMQIGLVIMWMGLPQLFIMPFAAKLSTKLDNRVMMSVGLALFARPAS
jgi:DHA2 family multidrug resistance protein